MNIFLARSQSVLVSENERVIIRILETEGNVRKSILSFESRQAIYNRVLDNEKIAEK